MRATRAARVPDPESAPVMSFRFEAQFFQNLLAEIGSGRSES